MAGASTSASEPLKLVIVSMGRGSAPWRRALAEQLASHPGVHCCLALHVRAGSTSPPRLTSLAARGYVALDQWQRALRDRAMPHGELTRSLELQTLSETAAVEAMASACGGTAPDVVLYLGAAPPPAWLVQAAALGVIEPWDATGPIGAQAAPWSRERLAGEPVITLRVMHRSPALNAPPRAVHRARLAHRSISPAVNAQRLITRASELLLTVIERRLRDRARLQAAGDGATPTPPSIQPQPDLRRVTQQLRLRLRGGGERARWHLAYRRLPAPAGSTGAAVAQALRALESLESFDVLAPPDGCFWADPFVVEAEGRTLLYFEQQRGAEAGTIEVAELLADGRLTTPLPVLRGPGHLSYPHVFQWDGHWWMIPESAEAGEVALYRCAELPDRWQREATLLVGDQLVDCTPFVGDDGRWWMFASRVGADPFPQEDLLLFSAPAPTGPWRPHSGNPVVSDVARARPAGAVQRLDGKLLRPGQDCSVRYGYGLTFQRVHQLDDSGFAEAEFARINPPASFTGLFGVHTFNQSTGLVCIDLLLAEKGHR